MAKKAPDPAPDFSYNQRYAPEPKYTAESNYASEPKYASDKKEQDDLFEEIFSGEQGYQDEYDRSDPFEDRPRKPRRKKRSAAPVVVLIIAIALAFLFIISPKFLGIQILPFDPFGFSDEIDEGEGDGDEDMDDMNSPFVGIDRIGLYLVGEDGSVESIAMTSDGTDIAQELEIKVGDYVNLMAMIEPVEAERNVETEWSLINASEVGYFVNTSPFEAVYLATAPGDEIIEFIVYNGDDVQSVSVALMIDEPTEADGMPPFKGDTLVTKANSGIFIRSDHLVNGEANTLNDGNKIGWIAAGDKSVHLVSTGKKWEEEDGSHWWYEVEIPQTYRDTKKQSENYAGKPLKGWVRSDLVEVVE